MVVFLSKVQVVNYTAFNLSAEFESERALMRIWMPIIQTNSGSDVYFEQLASSLEAKGYDVILDKYPHIYEISPSLIPKKMPKNVDLIHSNSWCAYAFKDKSIPLVTTVHHCVQDPEYQQYCSLLQKMYHKTLIRRFESMSFECSAATVGVSEFTVRTVMNVFPGITPIRIYNGIDTKLFSPKNRITKGSEVDDKKMFKLFAVSNLSKRKGAELYGPLLDGLGEGYELFITGGLRNGSPALSHPRLHHTGFLTVKDLVDMYRQADAFVSMSRYEGFGLSLAEAMSCGVPCVASSATAFPELIEDKVNGLLCEVDNIECFAQSIRLLKEQPSFAADLGRNARSTVLEKFNLSNVLAEYDQLYRTLTSAKTSSVKFPI